MVRTERLTLLSAPVGTPLRVTRIIDQEPEFLLFAERFDLVPGRHIVVEARDDASDSVQLRSSDRASATIGARAAEKVLVETLSSGS
jgi:hypothetical protein